MNRGRITASPRPCNRRRVVAKKRRRVVVKKRRRGSGDGFVNSVKKLQRREICAKTDRGFRMFDAQVLNIVSEQGFEDMVVVDTFPVSQLSICSSTISVYFR
ncbi:uncharacterized protein LOC110941476 isoform X2 [Helianthus annuus]|uniref:uncharacterized protein LOC110941476 isoform X2 n=1 Tax=Helianthus annuus TaxID=4232 RepID=UPI001652C681|nr:uncharacterized protein LOC110941476 isoform X2 [Helianthus annuus]